MNYVIRDIISEGNHLFLDNYYTSYRLLEDLSKRYINVTGTVRIDRLELDRFLKNDIARMKLMKHTWKFYKCVYGNLMIY